MSAVPQLQCKKGKHKLSLFYLCLFARLSLYLALCVCVSVCACVFVCLQWGIGVWAELHGEVRFYLHPVRDLPSLVHVHVRGGGQYECGPAAAVQEG